MCGWRLRSPAGNSCRENEGLVEPFKILFIKPHDDVRPSAIEVPLGILYLSAYLKQQLIQPADIRLIDLRFSKHPRKDLSDQLFFFRPHVVAVSLLALNETFLTDYAVFIKECAPNARLVIGGPYVTGNFEKALTANPTVDAAVIGEGEKPFLNLVTALMRGERITDIKSIAYRDGSFIHANQERDYVDLLDDLPFPDYSLVNFKNYWKNHHNMNGVLADKKYTHIISSRACPYNCIYCHDVFGKTVRRRSPENFVSEIKTFYDTYGITEFHIVDDIFNLDRDRLHRILNLIIVSGLKIKMAFPNGVRGDILAKEDIDLLQRAGAYMITFAVESGSPRIQKVIRKNLNIEKVLENIDYASDKGIITKGFFMLGFPGETEAELEKTVSVAVNSKLDLAHFFTVTPFAGTELANLANRLYPGLDTDSSVYYWQGKPFYQLATGFDLNRFQKRAYLRFYGSARTVKTFIKMPRKLMRLQRWAVFAVEVLTS